jgi:serine/threonine protein kinase
MDKGTLMPYEGLLLDYNQDGWGSIQLKKHVGAGGYGDVFHGVDASKGDVAVKIIRNVDSAIEEYRVKNECNVDLPSEHIVPVVSSQKWNPTTWIILFEYFDSEPLESIIEKQGAFDVSDLKHYMAQLINALHTAHGANILHRDIKPGNILISGHSRGSPGVLKVIDFGVSKFRKGESMTITDTPVGTIPYMCTNVYANGGKDASFAADIFSFGVTVAEMLLGQHPWWSDYPGILEVVKAQKEKGKQWMLPDTSVPSGGEAIWELACDCTRFAVSERPRQWNDIAIRVGLDLGLEPVGEREFTGEVMLTNESGANLGGLLLVVLDDGGSDILGREKISYNNKRLSREHVMFMRDGDKLMIVDMGSRNGTWLDGEKLEPEHPKEAHDGSNLRLEDVFIKLEYR